MSRRFQFSLRTLLVAMLIVAAFLGGMAAQRSRLICAQVEIEECGKASQAELLGARIGSSRVQSARRLAASGAHEQAAAVVEA